MNSRLPARPAPLAANTGVARAAAAMRRWLAVVCTTWAVCLLYTTPAAGYPQFAAKGEFTCLDCHYSPTGGGLTNSWGRQSRDALWDADSVLGAAVDEWWAHRDATVSAETEPNDSANWVVDVGAEARWLTLARGEVLATFPMLTEIGTIAARGPWQAYATAGLRKGSPHTPLLVQSREHWVGYALRDQLMLRGGRMVLPFGLRLPDHTLFVRQDLGFGPWGQSYAVSMDWTQGHWAVSAALFAGDWPATPPRRRLSGAAIRGAVQLTPELEVGVSGLVASSDAERQVAASTTLRLAFANGGYALAEVDWLHRSALRRDAEARALLSYARVGYFVHPAVDAHLELNHRHDWNLSWRQTTRATLGTNLQLTAWFEVVGQLHREARPNFPEEFLGTVQAHWLY